MSRRQSASPRVLLRGILGIFLIGFLVASICTLSVFVGENTVRYDCYVWGFYYAICRHRQTAQIAMGKDFCIEHLNPVIECEGFAETESGMSDAWRFVNGESVESPEYNRDYRSFDLPFNLMRASIR